MPLNINFQQIFLHLFNFIILFGGLYILLYKPVVDFMNKREKYYANLEQEKEQALKEAMKSKAQYEKQLLSFNEEMAQNKAKAIKETEELVNSRIQSAKEEADKIVHEAYKNADLQHAKMIEETKEEITALVLETTRKVLETEDMYEEFVKAASQGDMHE
ncbi:ATP synthase F0 subunit B [Floccifex sp.]|uniref:ATP synthase F0 subunit B n=1 Tax=Floccifex sp. TaxID=2815810 RepID=UPI003F09DD1E